MGLQPSLSLRVVDGCRLDEERRRALRPAELVRDRQGRARRLPRYYYQVPSWDEALATQLTPHFGLWELLDVDFREERSMTVSLRDLPSRPTIVVLEGV